jgi:hypothetical protein
MRLRPVGGKGIMTDKQKEKRNRKEKMKKNSRRANRKR